MAVARCGCRVGHNFSSDHLPATAPVNIYSLCGGACEATASKRMDVSVGIPWAEPSDVARATDSFSAEMTVICRHPLLTASPSALPLRGGA